MDFHKPHAAKTWREFFIEIGTIVTGILIALSLEQAIETIHERRIATEARDAVRAEVQENLYWLGRIATYEACTRSRLQQIGQLLDAANHGRPYTAAQSIGFLPRAKLTSQRWEANAEAGRASLFSPDDQRDYDNIYFTFASARAAQAEEESLWSRLKAIEGQDRLTPEAIYGFSVLLSQERYENALIQLSMLRAFQDATSMHLTPVDSDPIKIPHPSGSERCPPITDKADEKSILSQWYANKPGSEP
ncbi:MAG: hypothetical protein ABSD74_12235 [Rhizomicrobium sp.]